MSERFTKTQVETAVRALAAEIGQPLEMESMRPGTGRVEYRVSYAGGAHNLGPVMLGAGEAYRTIWAMTEAVRLHKRAAEQKQCACIGCDYNRHEGARCATMIARNAEGLCYGCAVAATLEVPAIRAEKRVHQLEKAGEVTA